MNWYYENNKKKAFYSVVICFVFFSSSFPMMDRIKNIFSKKKKEEVPLLQKVDDTVTMQLKKHPQLINKIKQNFTQSQVVCIGAALGGCLGYAFKPLSSVMASGALTLLVVGGQFFDVYDLSKIVLIKKIKEHTGIKSDSLAIALLCLPCGLLMYKTLPIATTALGALLGYYIYQK